MRRRQLILLLAIISGSLTIGLAITPNLVVFEVLSYVIGFVSVTPQIMIVRSQMFCSPFTIRIKPHSLLPLTWPRQNGARPPYPL